MPLLPPEKEANRLTPADVQKAISPDFKDSQKKINAHPKSSFLQVLFDDSTINKFQEKHSGWQQVMLFTFSNNISTVEKRGREPECPTEVESLQRCLGMSSC